MPASTTRAPRPYSLAFARVMQLPDALGVPPLGELHDGLWRHDLGDGWRLCANGARQTQDGVPGFHIAVWLHNQVALVVGPYHGVSSARYPDGEERFIALVEASLRALGHEPWAAGDPDVPKARAQA